MSRGSHGKYRRYIEKAVESSMPRNRWFYARELVDEVSEKAGKHVSANKIGAYLRVFFHNGVVERVFDSPIGHRYKLK